MNSPWHSFVGEIHSLSKMAATTCYISCGCNRTPFSADWGQNKLICYATCRAIAIYRPEGWSSKPASVIATLTGHKDRVNCVQWIRNPDGSNETEFISGSVDKTVRIWKGGDQFVESCVLTGHTAAVNALSSIKVCPNIYDHNTATTYIASASTDSTVRIWRRDPGKDFQEVQVLKYGSGFVLAVAFALIPGTNIPILACGVDDSKVHLYTLQDDHFREKMSLSGHEDWVRDIQFAVDDVGDLLLASCSQDHFIRLWRLTHRDSDTGKSQTSIGSLPLTDDIKMRENTFAFTHKGKESYFAVSLETVLSGHDNWVYSIRWQPRQAKGDGWHQPMCLLSASMDKTMIVWKFDVPPTGVWLETVRVGEVGGNSLGFYGGLFSPDGASILAHGYHGAFHHWSYNETSLLWESTVTGGGHFASVQDLDWDKDGQFLLSVSEDQTTRLHAPWVATDRETCWYELARPQIHGYDLQCMCMIGKYQFASGADEKVVRVFQAPQNFIKNFCKLSGLSFEEELKKESVSSLPEGASVPALGLSNKAIFQAGESPKSDRELNTPRNDQYTEAYFKPINMKAPPSEENLLQNTLWPEVQKLYGHGYEIFALASDPQGTVVASACKASKAEFANILLWDTSSWRQICSLEGASLTVTQMTFSHSGQYLLAVSRDRTWTLYTRQEDTWVKACSVDKKTTSHSRIIWAASWSHDDKYFITVSRDKKATLWSVCEMTKPDESPPKPLSNLDLTDAVTAVDVAPCLIKNRYLVALGLECGHILMYWYQPNDNTWSHCLTLTEAHAHHLAVKRLCFRPQMGRTGINETSSSNWLQLASGGQDYAVKVHDIDVTKL